MTYIRCEGKDCDARGVLVAFHKACGLWLCYICHVSQTKSQAKPQAKHTKRKRAKR